MNAICQFRKCTLTDEELLNEVERITDEMYFKNHEVPMRQIPARPNKDYDLLIGELIIRFREKGETRAKSYLRGHKIEYVNDEWVYSDTKESTEKTHKERPCEKCGKMATKEGHDACIANLPGVKNACCGHGKEQGYIQFEDGRILRFDNLEIDE